jgi:hypothetical protein
MITLEANYSKKLGLPEFSSHQFSLTLTTEISDLSQVQSESARLYQLLQTSVDSSLQETGYLPGKPGNGNAKQNGNGHTPVSADDEWKCSPAQKDLILKIVDEQKLNKLEVEKLAADRFGVGVKSLNKLQASALIEELLEQTGQRKNGGNRFHHKGVGR